MTIDKNSPISPATEFVAKNGGFNMANACLDRGAFSIEGRAHRLPQDRRLLATGAIKTGRIVEYRAARSARMIAEGNLTFCGSVPISRCRPANCDLSTADLDWRSCGAVTPCRPDTPNSRNDWKKPSTMSGKGQSTTKGSRLDYRLPVEMQIPQSEWRRSCSG